MTERCTYCDAWHEKSVWEDGSRYCSDACTVGGRLDAAEAALRLVPRARGDHRAGCPAGLNPQAVGVPQGTRACTCYVDPVRRALGEPTTDEETTR